jgi:hypothetical protein
LAVCVLLEGERFEREGVVVERELLSDGSWERMVENWVGVMTFASARNSSSWEGLSG